MKNTKPVNHLQPKRYEGDLSQCFVAMIKAQDGKCLEQFCNEVEGMFGVERVEALILSNLNRLAKADLTWMNDYLQKNPGPSKPALDVHEIGMRRALGQLIDLGEITLLGFEENEGLRFLIQPQSEARSK